MAQPRSYNRRRDRSALDFLTFDRLVAGRLIHLIYWSGLGVIGVFTFGVLGVAVGLVWREPGLQSALLALPTLISGLLIAAALVMIWRAFCEFYVIVFRISDDLRALRLASDAEHSVRGQRPPETRA